MIDFNWKTGLSDTAFSNGNAFLYNTPTPFPIFLKEDPKKKLVLMKNEAYSQTSPSIWKAANSFNFSNASNQFRGRQITAARLKELLNTPPIPIVVTVEDKRFIVGKGFLAHMKSASDCVLLMAAFYNPQENPNPSMQDVTMYVNRIVYSAQYNKVMPTVRDLMRTHIGDVVLTSNIHKCLGLELPLPKFKTLGEAKEFSTKFAKDTFKKLKQMHRAT